MWIYILLQLLMLNRNIEAITSDEEKEPDLYYYGLEESERGLPLCEPRQACSALLQRYWRPPALVRLCRCSRRRRCDTPAHPRARLELNNRAYLQFCKPITNWPACTMNDIPLTVETIYDRMTPDELEELHHQQKQMTPPKILFTCRCRQPNYWKLNTSIEIDNVQTYQCASLPLCKTGDFCGNVNYHLNGLYQSCLCPKNHICVSDGGIAWVQINELLYTGKGWKAYCQRVGEANSYEDY